MRAHLHTTRNFGEKSNTMSSVVFVCVYVSVCGRATKSVRKPMQTHRIDNKHVIMAKMQQRY